MNARLRASRGLLMKGSWKLEAAMAGPGNSEMRGKVPRGTGRTTEASA